MKTKSETGLVKGAVGSLEVRYAQGVATAEKPMKLVVLSHPHPLHGGTMNNKVITTMERAFQSLGYATVAFNFRGVGLSEGQFDQGEGEQADLMAVIDWAKAHFNTESLILAGFSFGSYISLKVQQERKVDALCTVAPPVGLYDFSGIHPVKVPWQLIQGGQDEVVSSAEILAWSMSGERQPDVYWRAGASHFLHGELIWLKNIILMTYPAQGKVS